MNPGSRFRFYPFEILTFVMVGVAFVILRLFSFGGDFASMRYAGGLVVRSMPSLLLLGFAVQLGAAALRGELRAWLRVAFSFEGLLLLARAWFCVVATSYAYTYLKVGVPILRLALFDEQIAALDRVVHLGVAPTVFAVELVRGTPVAGWLDTYYWLWLTSILVFQSAIFWSGNLVARRNFLLANGALWFAGAWLYVAIPAVGPAFATSEVYAEIRAEMPHAVDLQSKLWKNYLTVVACRDGKPRAIQPKFAVAAMPSLHVGVHFLFALWTRRHAPRLFLPCALATALTFLGSLTTGWHYALDGYAGMLLAWGAVALADRFEPVESEPPAPDDARAVAPEAAPASPAI